MQSSKLHIVVFVLAALGTFFVSCLPRPNKTKEEEKVKQDVLAHLNEKYGEQFGTVAVYDDHNPVHPGYSVYAKSLKHLDVTFQVACSKATHLGLDNYPASLWLYEGSLALKNHLKSWLPKTAVLVNPHLDYLNHIDIKNIPSFNEALTKTNGDRDYLDITIYIFTDYTDSSKTAIFEGLRQAVAFYDSTNLDYINYDIEFYDESFFKNADTDHQQYCFSGGIFYYPDWICFEDKYNIDYLTHGAGFSTKDFEGLPKDEFLKNRIVKYDHSRFKKKNDSLPDSTGH